MSNCHPALLLLDTSRILCPFPLTPMAAAILDVILSDANQLEAWQDMQAMSRKLGNPVLSPPEIKTPDPEDFSFQFNLPLYGVQSIPRVIRVVVSNWQHQHTYVALVLFHRRLRLLLKELLVPGPMYEQVNVAVLWAVEIDRLRWSTTPKEVAEIVGNISIVQSILRGSVEATAHIAASVMASLFTYSPPVSPEEGQ